MNYPSINEYKEAILFAEDNFEQLKNLRPVLGEDGEPVMTSGNFAVVFKMKDEKTGKLHAVKCFLREQEGRAEAYCMIAEELEYVSSTFLTPIKYLDKELFVDTNAGDETEFPVLLMDWVEGETLDKYIRKHLDDQYELSLLAYQFSRLAMWLMPQPFAHGDLKPDNILVKSDGTLVLVDYDGMYVPAMKGQKARELGSPDFRHPSRTESNFDEHIDDFSLASILLSLKAISLQPSLLEEYGAQDRLLFSEKDYRNLSESKVMDALKPLMQDAELASLYSLFILAISQNTLSGVSFRLFNLNRPSVSSPTNSLRVLQINKKISNQSNKKTIKKEVLASFQGKKDVIHFVYDDGTELWTTDKRKFIDEVKSKGGSRINTIDNDKLHVIYLYDDNDNKVGIYSIVEQLHSKAPKSISEIKDNIIVIEVWMDSVKQWISGIGIEKKTSKELLPSFQGKENVWHIVDSNGTESYLTQERDFSDEADSKNASILDTYENDMKHVLFLYDSKKTEVGRYYLVKQLQGLTPKQLTEIRHEIVVFESWNPETKKWVPCVGKTKRETNKEENLSTEVTDEDISKGKEIILWGGGIYSPDNSRLLVAPKNVKSFSVGESVKVICDGAFNRCFDLETVTIPDSVIKIGKVAFSHCLALKTILIPEGVISIDDYAFSKCVNLESITIPRSLSNVGKQLFRYCVNLKSIIIPLGTMSLFEKLLPDYKHNLVEHHVEENLSIKVTEEDLTNAWIDEYGVKYSKDKKRLLGVYSSYLPDYDIPEGTKVICDDSLNGIWQETDGLMISGKITIPSTVQNIGRNPFRGDYDTIICNSPYFVVEDDALYSVDKKRLIACFHKGFDFVVPDSVEEIGDFAFYACCIYCIKIPKSVSHIGDNPFVDAEINNVIIDNDSCYYYEENGALYRRNPQELVACWGKQNLLFVDENTTKIGPFAFWNGIERIGLPDSIRKISESAFYGYGAKPKQIYIPENSPIRFENLIIYNNKSGGEILKYVQDESGVIYSKDGKILLKAPKNIVEYNIKEDAIVIDNNAFSWCKELVNIKLSSSIKRIGERVFWCCRSLEQMIIPDSVMEIGIEAFAGCNSLKQIVIPNSITSIPNRAFSSCSSLMSISIPISVTHIGEFAFEDCNSLETISLPESVSSIGKDAFQDCWNLRQISIPKSITKISECTFLRCISLIQVIIPDSVEIIENGAFMECTKLQSISLPVGIKSINDETFDACYNLDEIVIPSNVESIGAYAFVRCRKLNKLWLSDNVTFIDPSAFNGCVKLEYIFIPDNTFVKFEKLLPEYREIMMEKVIIDNHEGLRRVFGKKEIESVNKAEVVRSALTNSVCFCMNDGCQKYIPLSKDSKLSIGDSIDLKIAKLIEFTDEGIYYGFDGYGEYYSKYLVEA